jgi:hypothetical protein
MIEVHIEFKKLSNLMHDVDDEEKVFHLCHHSKKLVVASRLINTTPSTPL